MSLAPLRVAAAAYVLEAMNSEELRRIADEALTRGVYTYSLGELGTSTTSVYSEVRPLFEAALKELAIPLPIVRQAADAMLTYHLCRLLEGVVSPPQAAAEVRELVDSWSIRPSLWAAFSAVEQDRLRRFEGCYWRYDEVRELSGPGGSISPESTADLLARLNQEMLQLVTDWRTDRLRGRIDTSLLTWNDGAVRKMAQAIRDDRRFSDLPLLADALEEAGCTDIEILEHCREQPAHVSGCWVVQLLLAAG